MQVPRLHPDTIEQVKERADIVDIVSDHVVLRKQGKDFVGLCPFHDDKSPSFSVSPGKQFYYCFSCGAGGNAIKFLMEIGKQSFSEVVLGLARRYQVTVQTLEPSQRREFQQKLSLRDQLYEILALTARFYQHALQQSQGRVALEYVQSSRHLTTETIQQFQLGYAPGGWQTLYGYLVEQKHYPVSLVEQAGGIVPRQQGGGHYDRFRDRLMIPIHDLQGRVIGFGGRTLSEAQPKYLNSPDTELFDKGKTLFGLDKAKQAIAQADCAIVVEGYFDVIALHAVGITNAVASLGTALNVGQVKQLLRYTDSKQVILNFDADTAGTKAANRAIGETAELAYSGDVQLRVLTIPAGKDPDEFLQSHSATAYQTLVQQAPLWLDWQIQQLFRHKNMTQADHFQQVSQQAVELLSEIANATTRTHYVRQCAEQLSQGDSRLVPLLADNLLAQVRRQRRKSPDGAEIPKATVVGPVDFLEQAEATLLRVYLHAPSYRQAVVDALDERDLQFIFSHHRFLWRTILAFTDDSSASVAATSPSETEEETWDLISQLRYASVETALLGADNQLEQVSHLFQLDEKTKRDILRAPLVIQAAVDCLERVMCEKRYQHFRDLWQQTDISAAPELCERYQQQLYAEKRHMQELDQRRSVTFEDLAQLPWVESFYDELER
ncbi:MAG: DNA primase [Cyanothece sp. SIO2G6]|nr:DNA primase [Cyanothece sp. SIO2G6]